MTPQRRPFKKPPPLSEERLRAAAVRYLARFSAGETQVLRVLARKIKRDIARRGGEEDISAWTAVAKRIVKELVAKGYVNDCAFAESRARSLLAAGRPLARIRADLAAKGVAAEIIEEVLSTLCADTADDVDLKAAEAFARRRRLGPYAPSQPPSTDDRRRTLGAFARAGFSYDIARRILAKDFSETE